MEEMVPLPIFNAIYEINLSNGTSMSSSSLTIWEVLSLGILVVENAIGSFMNGLMVIVNLISLLTHRKLGACDSILTCLGLSRFAFMWILLLMFFTNYLVPNVHGIGTYIENAWLFFNYLTLWFAAWLSIFYCVRIVNFQRYIFTAFKNHFDRLLPYLLLASIMISASCSNSNAYSSTNQTFNRSKYDNHKNSASLPTIGDNIGNNFAQLMSLTALGSIPPFSLFCVSAGLVVHSLLRHMKKMKGQERTGFREPSLDAHYQAIKMMGAFFIFFSFYLIAFSLYGSGKMQSGIQSCLATLLIGAYPSAHSILLVIGNQKLKHTLVRILQKASCYQKEVIQTISD